MSPGASPFEEWLPRLEVAGGNLTTPPSKMSIPFPMTVLASATSRISHTLPELDVLFKYVFLGLLLGLNISGHWPFVFGFCELPVHVLHLFFHQGISF